MRDIRFRAWDSELSFMVDPDMYFIEMSDGAAWFNNNAGSNDDHLYDQSSKLKLMQYTGLKDKNGKEIWENDLIQHPEGFYLEVKYCPPSWRVFATAGGYGSEELTAREWRNLEVAGNIHANPELLEQS